LTVFLNNFALRSGSFSIISIKLHLFRLSGMVVVKGEFFATRVTFDPTEPIAPSETERGFGASARQGER